MPKRLTHLAAIPANALLQQRLAKYVVLQCVRNSQLEDLHAGIAPSSASGDYADVTVTSPFGSIPWPRANRQISKESLTCFGRRSGPTRQRTAPPDA